MEERIEKLARLAGPLALVALAAWFGMVIFYAPIEKAQGIIQKIFYVHVPCWIPAYLGFFVTAVSGGFYLATRRESWDRLAASAAEIGVLFCTLGLLSGPLWAKPAWGHWWVWDLRLTTTLVLWFVYVAYLFLRAFALGSDAARNFAAIYGIAGTVAVPFVVYAVDLAKGSTLHPRDPAEQGLPVEMAWTLRAGMFAFFLVFVHLTGRRLEVARLEAEALDRALETG